MNKPKTKIVIDARKLVKNISGTERYISELVNWASQSKKVDEEIYILHRNKEGLQGKGKVISQLRFKMGIDLFHRTYQFGSLPEIWEMMLAGKCIFTFHDLISFHYPDYFPSRKIYNSYVDSMKLGLYFADRVIAISEHAKQDIIKNFAVPAEKIEVIYHGIDTKQFCRLSREKIDKFKQEHRLPDKYILNIGTNYPHKNLINLLQAFRQFVKIHPEYYLVLAGNNHYRLGNKYLAEYLKPVQNRVIRYGYVDDEDINALFNGASMFVFPSLYEGFGFPVLEAYASEVPVVCSDATSLPEVASEAAMLIDANKSKNIFKAMDQLITNNNLQNKLIEAGKEQVKKFSWDKCVKETYQAYYRTIDQPVSIMVKDNNNLKILIDKTLPRSKDSKLPWGLKHLDYYGSLCWNSFQNDGFGGMCQKIIKHTIGNK
ncbi:glycosyltransferase family 4 protein [Patescibacteria group bacterium]|nr:glycosyltransferase family 4 protein [Patescibacteria group bacterium]